MKFQIASFLFVVLSACNNYEMHDVIIVSGDRYWSGESDCGRKFIGIQNDEDALLGYAWCDSIKPLVVNEDSPCPKENVDKAIELWANSGLQLSVSYGTCDPDPYKSDSVCITAVERVDNNNPDTVGLTFWWTKKGNMKAADILVQNNCGPELIAHEIGHYLGFDHSKNEDSVMYLYIHEKMYLTPGEIEQLNATY